MRVKVLIPFKDRYTKKVYAEGEEITVTKERFGEINAISPLVEEITSPKEPKEEKAKTTQKKTAKNKTAKK